MNLKYFLSETIQAKENGSRGTHYAKFLISNLLKGRASPIVQCSSGVDDAVNTGEYV